MKRSFLLLIILISIFSCGRKRVIISEGDVEMDGSKLHWQSYNENDTFFKSFAENGVLLFIMSAKTEKEMNDSSFFEKDFSIDGKVIQKKSFLNGKPDGDWISFYPNGKTKSSSTTKDGILQGYNSWYENGLPQVEAKRQSDGKMFRNEYFPNGKLGQRFETDETGAGTCTVYYNNGNKRTEGNLFRFGPTGIWQRYDTLGHPLKDTLYGLNEFHK